MFKNSAKKIGERMLERKYGEMYIPEKGDLMWIDFNPQSGHEQKGRRPALVLSNNLYNEKTGLTMVCPITNTNNGFPLHVMIENTFSVKGFVMIEHIKSVDYKSRCAEFIEKAPEELTGEVLAKLYACLY